MRSPGRRRMALGRSEALARCGGSGGGRTGSSARLGFRGGGKMRGEREQRAAERPLILDVGEGGPATEAAGGRHGVGTAMAPVLGTVAPGTVEFFRKTPRPFSVLFSQLKTASIFYLNGALRHFQKL